MLFLFHHLMLITMILGFSPQVSQSDHSQLVVNSRQAHKLTHSSQRSSEQDVILVNALQFWTKQQTATYPASGLRSPKHLLLSGNDEWWRRTAANIAIYASKVVLVKVVEDAVSAWLNHKTAHTLQVTATKPKESIRNKSGRCNYIFLHAYHHQEMGQIRNWSNFLPCRVPSTTLSVSLLLPCPA